MSKKILLAGERGNVGRAFLDFFKKNYPDYKIECLSPFPFSLEKIAIKLQEKPFAFINCAGLTFNGDSQETPYEFFETNSFGVLRHLELIRKISPLTRYCCYGTVYESTHGSAYASSKRVSREILLNFRSSFNLYATQVTLGHTESKYRKDKRFLTSKIAAAVADIAKKMEENESFPILQLANIDEKFAFCATEDVVEGVWRALNQEIYREFRTENFYGPLIKDYSFHAREETSIRELIEAAFDAANLKNFVISNANKDNYRQNSKFFWKKDADGEFYCLGGKIEVNGQQDIYFEIPLSKGTVTPSNSQKHWKFLPDSHFAEKELGWKPQITAKEIIQDMVKAEINKNE